MLEATTAQQLWAAVPTLGPCGALPDSLAAAAETSPCSDPGPPARVPEKARTLPGGGGVTPTPQPSPLLHSHPWLPALVWGLGSCLQSRCLTGAIGRLL